MYARYFYPSYVYYCSYQTRYIYIYLLTILYNYSVLTILYIFQSLNPSPKFFANLKKTLGLSLVQEVAFAIALQHSENTDIRLLALEHIQKQLPELIKNYVNLETNNKHHEEGLHDSSPEVLHLILGQTFDTSNPYNLSSEEKEKFLKNLRRDFPRELVPVVLAPLLYPGDGETPQFKIELNMAVNQMVMVEIYLLTLLIHDVLQNVLYLFYFLFLGW